ncbi:hypothetical protein [Runella salmonicolor]|uniref:Cohesin domain-containing protein n=1 Tax=Runella salmonicolor TaxID=2950278 RepID=A0ABT1FVI2_9BACT|nr:hypothetical protein [Runella salmonicolor]MCP1384497.1 hypothetical protein [Runella salmonicolor]
MKHFITSFLAFALLMIALLSATNQEKRPIRAVTGGYMIEYSTPSFVKENVEGMKVDVALVDFTPLSSAKTDLDTIAILGKIYQKPSMFSIVTGTLSYVSSNAVLLRTKAKFQIDIANPKYGLIIVENDGKDNSGATSPSIVLYRRTGGGGCKKCGCACLTTRNGCQYCGIKSPK